MKPPLPALLLGALAFLGVSQVFAKPKAHSLEDLKKLDIVCLVPGWLPEGYHLKKVDIDYSDREGPLDSKAGAFVGYGIEYGNGKRRQFTLESARTGIGDRNLDKDERAEETQFETKHYGTVYIIYFPPGKAGVKDRIVANWIEDENLKAENAKGADAPRIKGRYHGVSGFGMTLADFQKIVQSLHPVREKSS
jgi:hypothetical protein